MHKASRFVCSVLGLMPCQVLAHSLGSRAGDLTPPMKAAFEEMKDLKGEFSDQMYAVRGVVEQFNTWPTDKPVRICFLSGSRALKQVFVDVAPRWVEGTSLRLDFGSAPEYRKCDAAKPVEIRVSFQFGGHWSFVGTDSLKYNLTRQSLNVDFAAAGEVGSEQRAELESIILHEMGHALGLQHEHQSPEAKCEEEFNWPQIYDRYGSSSGWTKEQIDFNFKTLVASDRILLTAYDRQSIMHYYFEPWMFVTGEKSKCYVHHNKVLSEGDKSVLRSIYPPQVASDDSLLQDRANSASEVLASLSLTVEQLGRVGRELAERLAARGRKAALEFKLGGDARSFQEPALQPCGPSSAKNNVVCNVSTDGSGLRISVGQ